MAGEACLWMYLNYTPVYQQNVLQWSISKFSSNSKEFGHGLSNGWNRWLSHCISCCCVAGHSFLFKRQNTPQSSCSLRVWKPAPLRFRGVKTHMHANCMHCSKVSGLGLIGCLKCTFQMALNSQRSYKNFLQAHGGF